MNRLISGILLVFILSGCQSNDIPEVLNENGTIINLDNLDAFVANISKGIESQINYVMIGEGEGERDVWKLSYKDDSINVQLRVDGIFKKEFNCKGIEFSSEKENDKYILKGCTGDVSEDFGIVVVPNDED